MVNGSEAARRARWLTVDNCEGSVSATAMDEPCRAEISNDKNDCEGEW